MAPPISRVSRGISFQPSLTAPGGSAARWIGRIRVQLIGAIALCVLMPALLRWLWLDAHFRAALNSPLGYSMLGTLVAVLTGYMLLRQFITFPGVKATGYILPSFGASYSAVALVFFFLRLDYSRWQFATSVGLAVLWFSIVYSLARTHAQPRLALIPGGRDRHITRLDGAQWARLESPPD